MKQSKFRFFRSALLAFLLFALVFTVPALAVSGDLSADKPTKQALAEKWDQVTEAGSLYKTTPSVTAPYAAGQLSDSFLQSGITYLNYVRFAAGLPQVRLDATLNADAQHGAVVLAALDTLTHYPSQPSGMSDEFYERGAAATSSSNISARWGYAPLSCLQSAVSGCMADNSSLSNLSCLGHRRWLLNPRLLNVGFGYAENESSGWSYIVNKIFDNSGPVVDYDYIAWPASGNFPTNLFSTSTPWSITVNPNKYQTPNANQIRITITSQSSGKKWSFSSATGQPTSAASAYFTVETSYYGIPNCIIFNPGSSNVDEWKGVYTVNVSGLNTKGGSAATLSYQVDFFDVDSYTVCKTHSYTSKVTKAATCGATGVKTYTCTKCGETKTETIAATGKHTWDKGVVTKAATCGAKGVKTFTCSVCKTTKTESISATGKHTWDSGKVTKAATCGVEGIKTYTCSVCKATKTGAIAALGHTFENNVCTRCGTAYGEHFLDVPQGVFYTDPVKWAAVNGITTGVDNLHFGSNTVCSRAQIVTFLWRSAGSPAPASDYNPFEDVPEGQFYTDAVLWAVENGITNGTDATHFSPNLNCSRAQIVTFLWRSAASPAPASDYNPFEDVPEGQFYTDAVLWAVEKGITSGTSDTRFSPNQNCNRAQAVTFLYRAKTN